MGTSATTALLTAEPMDPDELSTRSRAGDSFSSSSTDPSAASTLSFFATFLISDTASLTRLIAGCDFQPNEWRLKRARNSHLWLVSIETTDP